MHVHLTSGACAFLLTLSYSTISSSISLITQASLLKMVKLKEKGTLIFFKNHFIHHNHLYFFMPS